MIAVVHKLLGLYAFLLALNLVLPFLTNTRQRWMEVLRQICEPAVSVGRRVADRLIPNRRVTVDLGAVTAFLLCLLLRMVLSFFY